MASEQTSETKSSKSSSSKTNKAKVSVSPTSEQGPLSASPLAVEAALADPSTATPGAILQLQRTAGNQAVDRLLTERRIQAKLSVGAAGDKYEQEADRVARQVMNTITPTPPNQTQRQEDLEEEQGEGNVQRMALPRPTRPIAASISRLQRSTTTSSQSDLQRDSEAQPDPRDGFDASSDVEHRIASSSGGGNPLPGETRSFMESRFGSNFGGVRIHTGPESNQLNRSLSAQAFTHGRNIYFGEGKYNPGTSSGKSLLAHELTHVVQQGGAGPSGPVQRTPSNEGVIQRFSLIEWVKSKFSKKKDDDKDKDKDKDKDADKDKPKEGDKDKQPAPNEQLTDAIDYERRLGQFAYRHGKANTAAQTMLTKMVSVFVKDFDENDEAHQQKLADTIGGDRKNSAGQVGKSVEATLGVYKGGTLRERLTALMNAMFGPFKKYITTAMQGSKWDEMKDKGLNVDKLKRRKRQMRFNPAAKDLYRDPGNPLDRKNLKSWVHTGSTRTANAEGERGSGRTLQDLEDQGVGLSDREREFQFPGQKAGDVSGEKVKWEEGGSYWKMHENNKWVKQVQNSLNMPVIAGPSGTMIRMFQIWEYLSKPVDAADWRLAVLGWMLSSNDHSFHEMMMTAADFGLPYAQGHRAYMDIKPLTVWELRQNVAKKNLFPHELAFQRKAKSGGFKMLEKDAIEDANDTVEDLDQKEAGALSGPGAAAIQLYTSFGYLILNPARSGGMFANMKVERALKGKDELSHFKDDFESGKLTAKELMAEAQEIIPVLESALESLPDWSGDLYRGTGVFNPFAYSLGSTITFGAFTSSTLDEDVAKDFADNFNIGPYKFILKLKTTSGKDIRKISVANEDEILIPPGSKFQVTERTKPTESDKYYRVTLNQVGKGGGSLNIGEPAKEPEPEGGKAKNTGKANQGVLTPPKGKTITMQTMGGGDIEIDKAVRITIEDEDRYPNFDDYENVFVNVEGYGFGQIFWDSLKPNFVSDTALGSGEDDEDILVAEDETPKPTLAAFYRKEDDKPTLMIPWAQRDDISNEAVSGEWTVFFWGLDSTDYWVKTVDLEAFYKAGNEASKPKPKPLPPVDKHANIILGKKYSLTYPPGTTLSYFEDPDTAEVKTITFTVDQRVVFSLNDLLKQKGRAYSQIMGTGKNVYMSLDAVFDKDGQPSLNPDAAPIVDVVGELPKEIAPEVPKTKISLSGYMDTDDEEPSIKIEDPSDIVDRDVSDIQDKGIHWKQVHIQGGSLYWVQKNALDEFLA